MRKSLIFLMLVLCLAVLSAAEKDRLAVMDVQDEAGILDEKAIITVTDYIFTKFQGTGLFWMIPKSDRDTALDKAIEETKISSRKECVDEKCQLSLVAELQANFLIDTKIKKLYEGTCNITISKFDVEKRAGVFSWESKFDCSSKGVFDAIDGFELGSLNTKIQKSNKKEPEIVKKEIRVWSKKASNTVNWSEAKQYCESLEEDGYSDWRLPTISELRTLIQNCPATETGGVCKVTDGCLSSGCWSKDICFGCPLDGRHSKLGDKECFWSLSELSDDADSAWGVYFANGDVHGYYRSNVNYVRCIR